MMNSHGASGPASDPRFNPFRTVLDEDKLRTASAETQLVVPHYIDLLSIARAELAELEARIASAPSVGEADRLKWRANELRKTIGSLWATVAPFQRH